MKLAWTFEAIEDRHAIFNYIEAESPNAALSLDEKIEEGSRRLTDFPGLGRVGRVSGTYELVVHQNYILVYDTAPGQIRILRVLHAARQWPIHDTSLPPI